MKFVILLLSSLLLTACGGGASVGGSGSGGEPLSPVAAATTFALKQAYTNEFMDTKPYTFAVSGNVIITNDNPPSSISGAISGTGSDRKSNV